jgi:hypothetical protein
LLELLLKSKRKRAEQVIILRNALKMANLTQTAVLSKELVSALTTTSFLTPRASAMMEVIGRLTDISAF